MKKISKIIFDIISLICGVLLVWLICSWCEVSAHNTDPDYIYSQYNIIVYFSNLIC